MGRDGDTKGRCLIAVNKRQIMDKFVDSEWLKSSFKDAKLLDVEYDFTSDCFRFKIESESLRPVPEGHIIPTLIPKPPLGLPPQKILEEIIYEKQQDAATTRTKSILIWLREKCREEKYGAHFVSKLANELSDAFL